MRALGFLAPSPTLSPESFSIFDLPVPDPLPNDVVVRVHATSLNPVDYKQRRVRKPTNAHSPVILGWDGAGVVHALGESVSGFTLGERVFYAGDLLRAGSNAEYQVVDHRLIAPMPKSLDFALSSALPLTSLTAYEALFEQMRIPAKDAGQVLIVGGAGGVGSIAIQLLKACTDAEIFATAGREESAAWVRSMGAHHVVSRDETFTAQAAKKKLPSFDYIFSTTNSDDYLSEFPEILKPFGSLALIDDPQSFDIIPFKRRSQSVHWELMFTKSLYDFKVESQGEILTKVSNLVDAGKVKSTMTRRIAGLTPEALIESHRVQESGGMIGKGVIEVV